MKVALVLTLLIQSSISFGAAPSKALIEKILKHKELVAEENRLNEKFAYQCALPTTEGDIMWNCEDKEDFNNCPFSVMIVCSDVQERFWGSTHPNGEVKITSIEVE